MADSTHTLEIELRTKDFATASLKRVGDEGKKAAETISTSMDSAGSTIKSFGDRWLKLDGDFKMVAKAGAQAMNAVNVGIQTANMNSENMGRTLVSAGSSIAMGFATGGPVGGALAATAAAVGLIAGAFDDTEEAAQRARDEILKMQPEMNRLSTTFTESVKKIITLRGEQARSIEISERMQRTGETRAQATYEVDLARAAREVTKAYQDRRKALEEASKIMKAAGDLTNKEEYARIKAQEQAAMAAFEEAERAVKALADLRAGRATDLALLDKIAQKEQEAAQRRKEAEAEKGRAAQLAEENKQLAEQAKEMIRINKLSEEGKAIDGMRQMMIRLQAAGMKDLAAQLNTMIGMELMRLNTAKALNEQEQKRKQELEAARDAFENNIKDMGFFNDQAKQAKEHIKGIAKTDLASPIRQAAQELKRLTEQRAPGRGGAQFDEEGNFLGLGLAEARQERRDALRSMKRRRAERGRMGVGIGKSVNLRSGRRAGGLGAFSAWQGGGGDMGITQPGDEGTPSASPNIVVSLDQAPVSDVGIMRAATKSKMTGVPSLDLGIEGAKVTIASVLEKATKATEGLVEAAKEGAKSAETAKTNTDTAASETSRMADALEGMSSGMQELSTSMAQAAQAVTAMSTVVTKVVSDVERLKEAARLMGGN